jgi:hypothetical protein
MEMTMDTENTEVGHIQRAITRVQAFLQPPATFASGYRIYEPEDTDVSTSASTKRELFKLAFTAIAQAERAGAGKTVEYLTFDSGIFDEIVTVIDPAEQPEFRGFAAAVEELIGAVNARHP